MEHMPFIWSICLSYGAYAFHMEHTPFIWSICLSYGAYAFHIEHMPFIWSICLCRGALHAYNGAYTFAEGYCIITSSLRLLRNGKGNLLSLLDFSAASATLAQEQSKFDLSDTKMNENLCATKDYENQPRLRTPPIQTQFPKSQNKKSVLISEISG